MLWDSDAMMDDVVKTLVRRLFPGKHVFLCQTPDR